MVVEPAKVVAWVVKMAVMEVMGEREGAAVMGAERGREGVMAVVVVTGAGTGMVVVTAMAEGVGGWVEAVVLEDSLYNINNATKGCE